MTHLDFNRVAARHDAIDARLSEWARWVKVTPQRWATQPMFRAYRAPKQFESDLYVPIAINTLAAHEIEKAVSFLPEKHRTALRWHYVWPGLHVNAVRRELGVTEDALLALVNDGRDMLINRLRQRLVDVG